MKKETWVELIGTLLLSLVVAGSGIMGQNLSSGNTAIALLINSLATMMALFVLIRMGQNLGDAHFNPVVTLHSKLSLQTKLHYISLQITGAVLGVFIAHSLFSLPIFQVSSTLRFNLGTALSELISTLILLFVVDQSSKLHPLEASLSIAFLVGAGYFFTSSTFFVNPAMTIARMLTRTFVGITPLDGLGYILMQGLAWSIYLVLKKSSLFKQE